MGFPRGSAVKNPPADAGDAGDMGSIPESVGRRHDNPLQYSCWENPMDRGACQVTIPGVTKNRAGLKRLNTHTHIYVYTYSYVNILNVIRMYR